MVVVMTLALSIGHGSMMNGSLSVGQGDVNEPQGKGIDGSS